MAEYIDRTQIEWYGCDFENSKDCIRMNKDCQKCDHAECFAKQVRDLPTADVVERSKIDAAIEEMTKEECNTGDPSIAYGFGRAISILKKHIGE